MLLLTFTVGANRYAIDVVRVVEVLPRVDLRTIAHAPASLAGLLEYRGKIVPVVDLGLLLDVTPSRDCLSTRIILVHDSPDLRSQKVRVSQDTQERPEAAQVQVNRNQGILGLIAEHVSDLTSASPEHIVPSPVWLQEAPYLGAIVQTDKGLVQLIMVEEVRGASLRSCEPRPVDVSKSIPEG